MNAKLIDIQVEACEQTLFAISIDASGSALSGDCGGSQTIAEDNAGKFRNLRANGRVVTLTSAHTNQRPSS